MDWLVGHNFSKGWKVPLHNLLKVYISERFLTLVQPVFGQPFALVSQDLLRYYSLVFMRENSDTTQYLICPYVRNLFEQTAKRKVALAHDFPVITFDSVVKENKLFNLNPVGLESLLTVIRYVKRNREFCLFAYPTHDYTFMLTSL